MYDSGQDLEDGGGHGFHDVDPNSIFQAFFGGGCTTADRTWRTAEATASTTSTPTAFSRLSLEEDVRQRTGPGGRRRPRLPRRRPQQHFPGFLWRRMYDSGQDLEDGGGHGFHDVDPNSIF